MRAGGRLLYPGCLPYGSELGWSGFELPPSENGGAAPTTRSLDYFGLSLPYLRFQLRQPGQLGPDPSQWQFTDQGFRPMFPTANIWDAMSTDLRAFRTHGGKLLMWQGWSDNGSGNPDQAASFQPVRSPGAHYTNWIGNDLFDQPIGGDRRADTMARRAHT